MKSSDCLQTSQKLCVVLVTCPSDKASEIAGVLVEKRAAACVNITSELTSTYFWNGSICSESEKLLIIKTLVEKIEFLEAIIKEIHPYTVPEFVVLPSFYTGKSYFEWAEKYLTGS